MPCLMCGACCRGPWIPFTPRDMRKERQRYEKWGMAIGGDFAFVLEHFRPLAKREADKMPKLKGMEKGMRYSCDLFDPATNRCKANGSKPRVCLGYPWYNGRVSLTMRLDLYSPDCGYRIEQERARLISTLIAVRDKLSPPEEIKCP